MNLPQGLAGQVLEVSLALSPVVALLLALRPLLGRRYRAGLYYWAWLLIALRLAVPVNVSLPQAPVQVTVPNPTVTYTRVSPPVTDGAGDSGAVAGETVQPPAPAASPEVPAPAVYAPSLTLTQLAGLVWLAGGAAFFLFHLLSCARFRLRIRRWRKEETDPAVLAQFEALRADLGVKSLTLVRCAAVSSPLVTGFLHPTLLLPRADYTPEDLDAVFRHELTHVRRHDLWYKLLLLLARSVHWFNPLVHLMARRAERDLEISCDEAVVAGQDAAFQARYGHAVLTAAERSLPQSAPLTTHFQGGKGALLERMKAIAGKAGKKKGLVLLCAVAVVVGAAAGACAVTGQAPEPSPTPGAPASPSPSPEPTSEPTPEPTPTPNPTPQDTAAVLSALTVEDFSVSSPFFEGDKAGLLSALQRAVEHPVDPEAYEWGYIGIWYIDISLSRASGESGRPSSLYLNAGLTENLVEIDLYGGNWPSLWVDDPELYQLVRTVNDVDYQIDREALAAYREAVDAYLVATDDWANWEEYGWAEPRVYTHELDGFGLVDQSHALNAQVYFIADVYVTDPPEKAVVYLDGGCYLDSQLRYHPVSSDPIGLLLVAVDGKAAGFASWDWLYEDGGLAQYESKEALLAGLEPIP